MALSCQMSVSPRTYQVGQSPAPAAILTVYNPNSSAVVVTNLELVLKDPQGASHNYSVAQSHPPIGIGQTVSVPSLSSITIGPFPLVFHSAANANSFQMVPPGAVPSNPQGSMPPQQQIFVSARVYGSDGSINEAGAAGLLVSYAIPPPLAYQGGFAHFGSPNNAVLVAVGVG